MKKSLSEKDRVEIHRQTLDNSGTEFEERVALNCSIHFLE